MMITHLMQGLTTNVSRNQQPTCYSCGLKGHKSTSCTNKERGKKCYGCKNFGHIHANCPKNSTNSMSTSNRNHLHPSDRTVHPISQSSGQISANPMHIPITLAKIQFTALCDTGSQATIINDKTYRSIGSPPLHPSYITFSGMVETKYTALDFFKILLQLKTQHSLPKFMLLATLQFPLMSSLAWTFCNKPSLHLVFLQIPSPLWAAGSVRTACSMSPYATPCTSPADGSSVPTRSISEANGRRKTRGARVCELLS
ncbi:hypothetical protein HNY73_001828 [Argiope bruennichi]|uniref:CCHC-type domain-containing protein n=1 Tax=Argiope bruennichi TaxID=94029 RepID=A0A8T0FRK1_ARGBR|nr:hypothetical protein HNY73_001828 [Argiope bruennichi]